MIMLVSLLRAFPSCFQVLFCNKGLTLELPDWGSLISTYFNLSQARRSSYTQCKRWLLTDFKHEDNVKWNAWMVGGMNGVGRTKIPDYVYYRYHSASTEIGTPGCSLVAHAPRQLSYLFGWQYKGEFARVSMQTTSLFRYPFLLSKRIAETQKRSLWNISRVYAPSVSFSKVFETLDIAMLFWVVFNYRK